MTLELKYPLTLIVAGPSSCGKSTSVIRLLECREQLCDIAFENIVWCHSENNAPNHLKKTYHLLKECQNLKTPKIYLHL